MVFTMYTSRAEGNVNGEKFATFVRSCLLPVLQPFNYTNPHSVVILDNASIHHVKEISAIIEKQVLDYIFCPLIDQT